MNPSESRRPDVTQCARNTGPPIAALCYPMLIPQAVHQGGPCAGDARDIPAFLARLIREPKPGKRGNDHMKRIVFSTTMCRGIGQRTDRTKKLEYGSRPAVCQHDRERARVL